MWDARSRTVALWGKFAVIGGIGFLTEAAILQLLAGTETVGPFFARCVSFPTALTLTWTLNRRLTFCERAKGNSSRKYSLYVLGQTIAAFANLAIYAGLIVVEPRLRHAPALALAAGSLVGLIFNFWWANSVVFTPDPRKGETPT